MFKKTLKVGTTMIGLALSSIAVAADPAPASPHTFAANVGLYSQYIFRGLTQTDTKPAIQGGFDYSYNLGGPSIYIGTWNSNISWLTDGKQYSSSSLESDWYGGVRGPIGSSDFTYDVGFLYYYYPGSVYPFGSAAAPLGGEKGDTQEIYGALGWKWFTVKYSYGVGNKTFAVRDSSGTWYLDLSASYPVGETGLTLMAHWGQQKYDGTDPRNTGGASNDSLYSYEDWKIGATYDLGKMSDVLKGTTVGGYWTDTSGANTLGYGSVSEGGAYPRNISDGQFTVFLQKTF